MGYAYILVVEEDVTKLGLPEPSVFTEKEGTRWILALVSR